MRHTMGQSIVVNEKPSSNRGVVRFETNRALTGMGHERYLAGEDVWGDRPPDELARRILDHGGVLGLQINGNIVTVDLARGHTSEGLKEIIENLYRFYPDSPDEPTAVEEPAAEPAAGEPAVTEPAVEPAAEEAVPAAAPEVNDTAAVVDPAPSSADIEGETEAQAATPDTAPVDPTDASGGPAAQDPA